MGEKSRKNTPLFSISVDWFQTHNTQTPILHPGTYGRFQVKHLGRAGEFKNHYEILTAGERVATLTAHPDKGVLKPDCSFLKIDNKFLYQQDLKALILEINEALRLTFRNVSRVDIACDFNTFNNGLDPMVFIDRHIGMYAKYVKMRKAVLYTRSDHQRGRDRKGKRTENQHSYIRWGSPKGNLTYYLYDKTKEQREKKNKPWIAEKWWLDKLDPSQVWRLEFRVQSCSKGLIDEDGRGEILKYRKAKKFLKEIEGRLKRGMKEETAAALDAKILAAQTFNAQHLDQLHYSELSKEHKQALAFLKKFPFTRAQAKEEVEFFKNFENDFKADAQYFGSLDVLVNYHDFFNALYHHYFDFRVNDKQEKKRRMRRLSLLDIKKPGKHLMQIVETLESNRTDRIVLNKIIDMNDLVRAKAKAREEAPPAQVLDAIKLLVAHYSDTKDLTSFVKKKFPDFDFQPEINHQLDKLYAQDDYAAIRKHDLDCYYADLKEEFSNTIEVNGQQLERAPF